MATLTLGLVLHGTTSQPYEQTRTATAGPDVVASSVGFTGQAAYPRLTTPSKKMSAAALGRLVVMIYYATVGQRAERSGPWSGAPDPAQGRIGEVLLVVTVVMVILAAANAIFTTWATVLDARRSSAVARSLGATPQQAVAALSAAQLLPALAGALLGIPAGTALYAAV